MSLASKVSGPMKEDQSGGPSSGRWLGEIRDALAHAPAPVHLVGIGNPLRSDDAAGLEIIKGVRARLGRTSAARFRVHPDSPAPERLLSKLSGTPGSIVVFDSVEASKNPGDVVLCRLSDTKYGFFATHNIPLRLVPGLADRSDDVLLVGVQPGSLEVSEGLTDAVRSSVRRIVSVVAEAAGGKA
jgi:hydrogenase maturation protease